MNYQGVVFLLGRLLVALAAALAIPTAVALLLDEADALRAFGSTLGIAAVVGLLVSWLFRQARDFRFGRREAFLLVTSAWCMASLVGALPYWAVLGPTRLVDALFESASGFTTTGASILTDIEAQPRSLLLWRSLTQWLGGMGIIVLGIAVLPKLAVGGMELLGAEAPGPITEKLTPRIAQTAKALWGIYVLLTGLETALLVLLGMDVFDAVNHAFATMATGGFSTRNASVAAYGSWAIEAVITGFMFLAGINFALHFQALRGRWRDVGRDSELRFYAGLIALAALMVTADLIAGGKAAGLLDALRLASFQAVTIVTTTGFATADFDAWPSFSRGLLFMLMFVGGCAGSTGGSVKVVRMMIVAKKMAIDLKQLIQPHAVLPVRVGRRAIPDEVVTSVTTFFILFLTLFAFGGLALSAMGLDLVTAYSATAACLGNIGPGFDGVGPTRNFAFMVPPAKLLLTAMMIVGRLELYTVLVLFYIRRGIER